MLENSGVILGQRPEDYIAGASPIPFEERVPSGDWKPYLPPGERQFSRNVDTMACVSFSAHNCIEMQMKFYGKEVNLSDRFLAKQSGTTKMGNFLYLVGDTLRKQGGVPEEYWPAPKDFTWDSYYAEIPINIKMEGYKLLDSWDIKYEWLPDVKKETLKQHLKQSPIQVVIPGHAVTLITSTDQVDTYFDHYEPYQKEYTSPFQAALKYVVTPRTKNMSNEEVRNLYRLAFYREPDSGELAYWTGKSLSEFLKVAIADRATFLQKP